MINLIDWRKIAGFIALGSFVVVLELLYVTHTPLFRGEGLTLFALLFCTWTLIGVITKLVLLFRKEPIPILNVVSIIVFILTFLSVNPTFTVSAWELSPRQLAVTMVMTLWIGLDVIEVAAAKNLFGTSESESE